MSNENQKLKLITQTRLTKIVLQGRKHETERIKINNSSYLKCFVFLLLLYLLRLSICYTFLSDYNEIFVNVSTVSFVISIIVILLKSSVTIVYFVSFMFITLHNLLYIYSATSSLLRTFRSSLFDHKLGMADSRLVAIGP